VRDGTGFTKEKKRCRKGGTKKGQARTLSQKRGPGGRGPGPAKKEATKHLEVGGGKIFLKTGGNNFGLGRTVIKKKAKGERGKNNGHEAAKV